MGLGGAAAVVTRALGGPTADLSRAPQLLTWAAILLPIALAQELVLRGIVQRGLEELAERRGHFVGARGRALAALASLLLGLVAAGPTGAAAAGILLASHGAAAVTRAITGRNSASILTRVVALAAALAWGPIGP
jgi:hypothetical protein